MPALALSLLVGILAGYWVATPCIGSAALLAGLPGLFCWWVGGKLPLAVIAGFVVASVSGHDFNANRLAARLAPLDAVVVGVISDLPSRHGRVTSFTVELIADASALYGIERIRLNSYDSVIEPAAGETWQLRVRLKPVHGHISPGGFDRSLWMLVRQIHASGYVLDSRLNRRLEATGRQYPLLQLRSFLKSKVEALGGSSPAVPLLVGITVGIRNELTQRQWELLRKTGTSHLMAISGLHVGMVALLMWQLGLFAGQCLQAVKFISATGVAAVASTGAALAYAMLAGWSVPTTRAVVMVSLVVLCGLRWRHFARMSVVCCALCLVLMVDSLAILSAGFWLSFTAVTLLFCLLSGPKLHDGQTESAWWVSLLRFTQAQWVLTIGLAVPTAVIFSQVPLATPLANLIAIPLFSLVTVPAALSGMVFINLNETIASALLQVAAYSIDLLLHVLDWLEELPVVNLYEYVHTVAGMVTLFVLLILLLMPISRTGRGCCLLLIAVLIWNQRLPADLIDIHVLDVGQGLAVIVRANNRVLVYDTGPSWPGGDAGRNVLIPALRRLGVRKIDTVVISHGDNDHQGGLQSLLADFDPDSIITASAVLNAEVAASKCVKGQRWRWGDAEFQVLHPRDPRAWNENDASCVLQITVQGFSVLLPGDIEVDAELVLSGRQDLRQAQVLIAPHHGSRTSSSQAFVDALQPEQVVFTTGYLNRWGFPANEVVQRWQQAGACLFNTAASGTLFIEFQPGKGFLPARSAAASLLRPWPLRSEPVTACLPTL
jgi:competence protein ComEC